jgi:chaperonin GroEL
MAKQLTFDEKARESLARGVEKLARAVRITLGPRGHAALLDKGYGAPRVTMDGVSVAEDIDLTSPEENLGAKMLREAASKTNEDAGDGTTTATVLAEAIFREGLKNVTAGADAMGLSRGIRKATDAVVARLRELSKPVDAGDTNQIARIAEVAAHNDPEVGRLIAEAYRRVGKDGVITVEEGKSLETTVEVVEGMQFDRGYLSPHFVTDFDAMVCELENPLIFIHEEKLSTVKGLVPFLEKVAQAKRALLLIAEDVEGEALALLVVNKLRGVVQCCAVKAPGYGDRRKAMLQDIAILTGGRAFFKDLGVELEHISLADLGTAKRVRIDAENTTIVEGAGDSSAIEARCAEIRREKEKTTSDYDREKLEERLAKLAGGVAEVTVGGSTETEVKERKARIEDALHATRAALEEGVLPGGGVALLRAVAGLEKLSLAGDEATGVDIVRRALAAPLRQIAENAGAEGEVVVRKVAAGTGNFGFDAVALKYGDLLEAGVMDPTKVTRTALQNAASVACLLLTTNALVTTMPEEEEEEGGAPHGHGPGGMPEDEEF